jgi:hypothetical protein
MLFSTGLPVMVSDTKKAAHYFYIIPIDTIKYTILCRPTVQMYRTSPSAPEISSRLDFVPTTGSRDAPILIVRVLPSLGASDSFYGCFDYRKSPRE